MMPKAFVRDEVTYQLMCENAEAIFQLGARLPSQVFREQMGGFRFLDIVDFAQPVFWALLREITELFGDDRIDLLVQNPPAYEYKSWMEVFGALRFPCSENPEEYVAALKHDLCAGKVVPALYFSLQTAWWIGSSRRWGIYGDRNLDIAVAAILDFDDRKIKWLNLSGPLWLTKQQTKDRVSSNTSHLLEQTAIAEKLFSLYRTN